ncbi:MAG: S8 family serine peptidase [Bacteroidia bacterium]
MKKLHLLVLLLVFSYCTYAQTVFSDYTDGKVYVRVKTSHNPVFAKNRKNWDKLPLNEFPFLTGLSVKYGIDAISKPFFAAKGSDELLRTYVLEFSHKTQVLNLIADLEGSGAVDLAEKVPLMQTSVYTPNDYNGTTQWGLAKIGATTAWGVFNGNSTTATVAVVDNAVQITHTDLSANIWVNPNEIANNGIDDDGNGYTDDVSGYDVADNDKDPLPPNTTFNHGTHCAGIVGARTDNNTGISAIGFNVKVIAVKSTHDTSTSSAVDAGYAGIIYAVSVHARVISCSWGGAGSSATEQSVINYAWGNNCIIVAAAGNNGNTVQNYPGAYNNIYCVASTTSTDARSGFSNYGTWVDISAPGTGIYSTVPNNSYANMSGTSMATPLVAGLCGLMIAYQPYLTPSQVLNCISSTAVSVSPVGQMGAGRINAGAAMTCVSSVVPGPPAVDFISQMTTTCPSAPVKFFDKTFYGATAWSWSFQGGTPASSTAQNPTVSWASPGTYSVSLTATNPNGSATKIKTSYITVAGPTALPLMEGFTAATYPPAGWAEYDQDLDSVKWYRNTSVGGFGTSSQSIYFDNYNIDATGKHDQLWTPKYDFTGLSSATLKFDVAYARYDASYSDSLKALVSTDCGQTFTQVYFKGGTGLATAADNNAATFVPANTEWRTETVNLNSFIGQGSVLIAFSNYGHYGQALYIDNINITGVTASAPPTAGFTASSNPCTGQTITLTDASSNNPTSWAWTMAGASPSTSTAQNPTVSYSTAGTYTVSLIATNGFGASAPVSQTFTINTTPVATASNTGPFCTGSTITLNSTGTGTYAWTGPGTYTSAVQNPTRSGATLGMSGTYTVTITNAGCSATATTAVVVNVKPVSTVTVSATSFCAGSGVTLNGSSSSPGSGTISSYQWQLGGSNISGATSSTYSATAAGTYNLIVTNSNGCSTTSANKVISVNAIPSATVTGINSFCSGTGTLLDASSSTAGSGTVTAYQWQLGGSNIAGATTSTYSATTAGSYNVIITNSNTCKDTSAVTTVSVYSSPTVTANSPVICSGDVTTLNGGGALSYSWTGGVIDGVAFSPSGTQTYTVTGTDANNCANTAIATVTVNQLPLVTSSASPNDTICSGTTVSLSGSGASTYSWSGGISDGIAFSPSGTQTYTVTGSDANNCSNTAAITIEVQNCTGIQQQANVASLVNIFPNPNTGTFTLSIDSQKEEMVTLELVDYLGQIVYKDRVFISAGKTVKTVSVVDAGKGIYHIFIGQNNTSTIKKVIVD